MGGVGRPERHGWKETHSNRSPKLKRKVTEGGQFGNNSIFSELITTLWKSNGNIIDVCLYQKNQLYGKPSLRGNLVLLSFLMLL